MNVEIKSCIQCVNHRLEAEPDTYDWFMGSDQKVVCKIAQKPVARWLTVFEVRKPEESPIPNWCPLLKQEEANKNKENIRPIIL
jgi:hypothetical protein